MNKKVLFISLLLVLGVLLAACASKPAVVEAPVVEEDPCLTAKLTNSGEMPKRST
jgi:hypothetical protein